MVGRKKVELSETIPTMPCPTAPGPQHHDVVLVDFFTARDNE